MNPLARKALLSLTLILTLGGCAQHSQKPGDFSGQTAEQAASTGDLMPSAYLEDFAFDLLKDLRKKDFDRLWQKYDHEGFMLQVAKIPDLKAAHKVALNKALSKNPKFIISFVEDVATLYDKATDINLVNIDTQRQTIFYRIFSDTNLDYLEIHYRETSENQFQFVDIEEFLAGYRASELTALTMKEVFQLSAKGNDEGAKETLAYLKNFKDLRSGQIADFDNRLPEYLQDNELFLFMQVLVDVNKSETLSGSHYTEFYQRFPDSRKHQLIYAFAELSNDHPESALKHFSQLSDPLARDAAILNLQCQQHATLGQFQQAAEFCYQALRSEPTFDATFFTLTDLFLKMDRLDLAFDALKVLRDRFRYQIDEDYLQNNPRLEALRALPGFNDWISEEVQTS